MFWLGEKRRIQTTPFLKMLETCGIKFSFFVFSISQTELETENHIQTDKLYTFNSHFWKLKYFSNTNKLIVLHHVEDNHTKFINKSVALSSMDFPHKYLRFLSIRRKEKLMKVGVDLYITI